MLSSKKRTLLIFALSIYSVLVCVLDIVAPMGVEVWVLNLPVFLVPMFTAIGAWWQYPRA